MTGEIIADAGELISRAKAQEMDDRGVIEVYLQADGREIKTFSNGMVKLGSFVDFDPAELGIK